MKNGQHIDEVKFPVDDFNVYILTAHEYLNDQQNPNNYIFLLFDRRSPKRIEIVQINSSSTAQVVWTGPPQGFFNATDENMKEIWDELKKYHLKQGKSFIPYWIKDKIVRNQANYTFWGIVLAVISAASVFVPFIIKKVFR